MVLNGGVKLLMQKFWPDLLKNNFTVIYKIPFQQLRERFSFLSTDFHGFLNGFVIGHQRQYFGCRVIIKRSRFILVELVKI
jgi:hypothetical protein